MTSSIIKINRAEIKNTVLECVSRILNELSSKDWHDKYLPNMPEGLFYNIMGNDKKKTPIKELLIKIYTNACAENPEKSSFFARVAVQIARKCDKLSDVETQELLNIIQRKGINDFSDFKEILNFFNIKKSSQEIIPDTKMYAENCVNLYEDDEWLVLCPLTADASRKNCFNGNHWCTCSSSYQTYFPTYTYKSNSIIISFLNKKTRPNSFQIQVKGNGDSYEIVSCCDFHDNSLNVNECPNIFPGYNNVMSSLLNNDLLGKLTLKVKEMTNLAIPNWTDKQAITIAINAIENNNRQITTTFIENGVTINDVIYFPNSNFYIAVITKQRTRNVIVFLYDTKFGAKIIQPGTEIYPRYKTFDNGTKNEIDKYNGRCIPIGRVYDESRTKRNVLMYNKSNGNIYTLFDDYKDYYGDELIYFGTMLPVVYIYMGNGNYAHYDFNGNQIDLSGPIPFEKTVTLPSDWGGETLKLRPNYYGIAKVEELNFVFQENIITVYNTSNEQGLIYATNKYGQQSVVGRANNVECLICIVLNDGKHIITTFKNEINKNQYYQIVIRICIENGNFNFEKGFDNSSVTIFEDEKAKNKNGISFKEVQTYGKDAQEKFFYDVFGKYKEKMETMFEGDFMNGETLYDKIRNYFQV